MPTSLSTTEFAAPPRTSPLDDGLAEVKRRRVKRFLWTLPPYGMVLVLLALGVLLGSIQPAIATIIAVVMCSWQGAMYLVLRSPLWLHSKDPLLAFAQLLLSCLFIVMSYAILDALRSTALLWLTVVIVFDMRRLPKRQLIMAASCCGVLLVSATAFRAWWRPMGFNLVNEVCTLLLLGVALPMLIAVSAQARHVSQRRREQEAQMSHALAQLRELSIRDGLTGLYTRRHMLDLLEQERKRWQRTGHCFSVALIDIDFFKRVNDQFGHATGDMVLQAFAALGKATFPNLPDALARWGGEEFLLLQPQRTEAEAWAALAQLQEAVRAHDWSQYAQGLNVRFSAGLCEHQAGLTVEQTIHQADLALYRAKTAGRDRVAAASGATPPIAPVVAGPTAASLAEARLVLSMARQAAPAASVPGKSQEKAPARASGTLGRAQRLLDLILGLDPRLRSNLQMCLMSTAVYTACIMGFWFYVVPQGLLTRQQGLLFVAHSLLGGTVPALLVRLGVTAKRHDPSCTFQQLIWSGTGIIAGYGLIPALSTAILQMLCLCLVFGFTSLRPKEARFVGVLFIGELCCVLAARACLQPDGFKPRDELLEVLMTAVVLWVLTIQSERHSLARDRLRLEKAKVSQATEQVNKTMQHDALTGLLTRQHMQRVLDGESDRHARSGQGFCVALADLDHFKRINDAHGHQVGDQALIGFAKSAMAVLRETDSICRWGGEEFLVLLSDTEPGPHGIEAMNRLREHIAKARLSDDAPTLQVTFSAGVAAHIPGEPISAMIERADQALYAAKAAGRNRCVLAERTTQT